MVNPNIVKVTKPNELIDTLINKGLKKKKLYTFCSIEHYAGRSRCHWYRMALGCQRNGCYTAKVRSYNT